MSVLVDTSVLIGYLRGHPGAADLLEAERSAEVAEAAGALGRRWLPSHNTIDGADLAIAATAILDDLRLLTRNVPHFPMFENLRLPY